MLFDLAESDIYAKPGLPNLIKQKYDGALRKLAWGGVQGLARAATTGVVKGAIGFALMGLAVTVVSYALLGNAGGMGVNHATQAVGDFFTHLPGILTIAAGAVLGGYADYKKQKTEAQSELAETRAMMEKLSREQGQGKDRGKDGPDASGPAPAPTVGPKNPQGPAPLNPNPTMDEEAARLNRQRKEEFKDGAKNSFAEEYLAKKRNRGNAQDGVCR